MIFQPSSGDQSWGQPAKGIDFAHITEVLASKNCFFLLNLDGSIRSSIGIPHLVVRVLQNQENPLFSLKFYIWASSTNQSITSNRSIRSALSNILFKKGPVILSIDLLRDVNQAGCQITEELFCILIGSWGKLGLAKYCNDVFSQMSFLGLKPSTRLYNALIDALVKSNSLDQAYLKFHQMPGDSCFPDRFTYNILIHGLSKVGIVDEALRLMKQMESSGYLPNVFTYTILIDGFCNANKVGEAFQVLDTMRKRKIPPTGATYRTLVHGAFRCTESHEAYKLLVSFVDGDPVLHVDVCCTALYCLSKSGMAAEANEFLRKLRKRGYFPDNSTFNTVMTGLVRDSNVGETCNVMDDFVAGGGKPGFNIYIGLIAKLCKEGWENDTDRYLKQMMSEGLVQNVVSFNMLIDCFVKAKMMNRASNVFKEMVKSGVNPNLVTFNTLISGYCKIKEISRARELLKMLLECGLVPDVITFSSVIDGLCRAHQIEDAFNCFTEMVEWGVPPNNVTYNTLARALYACGEICKATKLFKKTRSDGISRHIYL